MNFDDYLEEKLKDNELYKEYENLTSEYEKIAEKLVKIKYCTQG